MMMAFWVSSLEAPLRVNTNHPQGDCYGVDNMSTSAVAEGCARTRLREHRTTYGRSAPAPIRPRTRMKYGNSTTASSVAIDCAVKKITGRGDQLGSVKSACVVLPSRQVVVLRCSRASCRHLEAFEALRPSTSLKVPALAGWRSRYRVLVAREGAADPGAVRFKWTM